MQLSLHPLILFLACFPRFGNVLNRLTILTSSKATLIASYFIFCDMSMTKMSRVYPTGPIASNTILMSNRGIKRKIKGGKLIGDYGLIGNYSERKSAKLLLFFENRDFFFQQ